MVDSFKHRVLLIGSGLMTPPLVDYLASFGDTKITVVSNMLAEAQKIAARHPKCMSAGYIDVSNVSLDVHHLSEGRTSGRLGNEAHDGYLVYPAHVAHESHVKLSQTWSQHDDFQLYLA